MARTGRSTLFRVWNRIRTAIDREGMDGEGDLYRAEEGLSRTSALLMHTLGTARQLRTGHVTGTVERGSMADLGAPGRDVTRCPVADISSAEVRLTLVGGTVVHDAQSSAGRAAAARVTRAAAGPRPTAYASVHGGRHGGRHGSCGCG
ncbi:amidohydrolase family protein [Streptomyces sp. NPDC003006]